MKRLFLDARFVCACVGEVWPSLAMRAVTLKRHTSATGDMGYVTTAQKRVRSLNLIFDRVDSCSRWAICSDREKIKLLIRL